jgi:ABC-type transport system involved in multi-copper enzyme maturation permease subunit
VDQVNQVNPLAEIWLIAAREFRKGIRSPKGLVMLGLSVLGALASGMRLFDDAWKKAEGMGPDAFHDAKAQVLGRMYHDAKVGQRLADAPSRLVVFFFIAVWLVPMVVTVVGFEGISADLQHRSVRYWTVRTRRSSYYVGKVIGLWIVIATLTLVMHAIVWLVIIARADAGAADTLAWGVGFWLVEALIAGIWCAIATLVGSFFRTPMLALVLTCAVFFALFFAGFVLPNAKAGVEPEGASDPVGLLRLLYPNSLDAWLLSPEPRRVVSGIAVCLLYSAAASLFGSLVFARRDV